jgi:transposase-like protein
LHVAYLREAVEIHGSRWNKLPERQRPHYTPEARFRIVRLKTLLGLSAAETARLFRISTNTVLRWEDEARVGPERDTVGSLLKPVPPVRRYAGRPGERPPVTLLVPEIRYLDPDGRLPYLVSRAA